MTSLPGGRHPCVRVNSSRLYSDVSLAPYMATPPARRRIKFSDVAIGERFYDPVSAEYFVKQSENLAAMVTGIGDGTVADEFEADDIVGVDLH